MAALVRLAAEQPGASYQASLDLKRLLWPPPPPVAPLTRRWRQMRAASGCVDTL